MEDSNKNKYVELKADVTINISAFLFSYLFSQKDTNAEEKQKEGVQNG